MVKYKFLRVYVNNFMSIYVDEKFLTTKGKYCKIQNKYGGDNYKKQNTARMVANKRD